MTELQFRILTMQWISCKNISGSSSGLSLLCVQNGTTDANFQGLTRARGSAVCKMF